MKKIRFILFLSVLLLMASSLLAVAPSDEVIQKWKAEGTFDHNMSVLLDFKVRGGCSPDEHNHKGSNRLASGTNAVDTARVIVIMVDFSDFPYDGQMHAGTVADFDSILFSDRTTDSIFNPTGSMTDFYMENSYGTFYLVGDIYGWYRMPRTYAQYATGLDGTGEYGLSDVFPNSQDLVYDAITAADSAGVDFSLYDFNNDFKCDGIVLIHAGPGAETTGDVGDIWSHKWSLKSTRNVDGVAISNYNMNPEEYGAGVGSELSPIGVFCHEFGHFLGLPDLYGTTDNSSGLGRWSLMSSGNYLGNSKSPAHFDAWCKDQIGFLTLTEVTENMSQVAIPEVESNPIAYKLQNGDTEGEYWIVENRRKSKFDTYLPGEGLTIYHIDEQDGSRANPDNYLVAMEQADGFNSLAYSGSNGDTGDPFPGSSNNRNFHSYTIPNSNTYNGIESAIAVWNISDQDSIIYADLDVDYSRPWIVESGSNPFYFDDSFNGDGDGLIEPGETIRFYFSIRNDMRFSYNLNASLATSNSGLQITNNNIDYTQDPFSYVPFTNTVNPIEFIVPDTITPHIDSFYLTIITDSTASGDAGVNEEYTHTFGFEVVIGEPDILIVDDDRGDLFETEFSNAVYKSRNPSDVWEVSSQGLPTVGDLSPYSIVIWFTGDRLNVDTRIDASRISVMKQYMDGGGNFCLTTFNGIYDINSIDPQFMVDYFGASYNKKVLTDVMTGIASNDISDGIEMQMSNDLFRELPTLVASGSGEPFLTCQGVDTTTFDVTTEITGVSLTAGTYNSVLLSFGLESMTDESSYYDEPAVLIERIVDFFGGVPTAVYNGENFTQIPNGFELSQNYPNPFNPTTTISYTIHSNERVGQKVPSTNLSVFNILGQKVITLVDEIQSPGTYQIEWDGSDSNGKKVSSGIYFYRLTKGENAISKKMTLLK